MFRINPLGNQRTKAILFMALSGFSLGLFPSTTSAHVFGAAEVDGPAYNQVSHYSFQNSSDIFQYGKTLPAWYKYGPKPSRKKFILLPPFAGRPQWCQVKSVKAPGKTITC